MQFVFTTLLFFSICFIGSWNSYTTLNEISKTLAIFIYYTKIIGVSNYRMGYEESWLCQATLPAKHLKQPNS